MNLVDRTDLQPIQAAILAGGVQAWARSNHEEFYAQPGG
jgi:hypothetical protein